MELSILLLVISIASYARTFVMRDDGKVAGAGKAA